MKKITLKKSTIMTRWTKWAFWTSLSLLLLACGERPEAFNSVDRFRLLAIKADPPALAEGESTELSALFHLPDKDAAVSYEWSWCPLATSPSDGTECLIKEEDLAAMVRERASEEFGAEQVAALPDVLPSFDLGTEPTAQFIHALPSEVLSQVCSQLISDDVPTFAGIPTCDDKLDVVIRLAATAGGETIYGVKRVALYIDSERADNENPRIDGLQIFNERRGREVLEADGVTTLERRTEHRLAADIPEDVPDTFTPLPTDDAPAPVPRRESMFITWYVTGGETEFVRTTFFDREIPLEELSENFWTTPSKTATPENTATLYLVIQDERGGIDWLTRDFNLQERLP